MKSNKKKHMWTLDEEKILLANKNLHVSEIHDRFFRHLSVVSVNHKLMRLQQQLTFNRIGMWTPDELAFLTANLDLANVEIQKTIPRPVKDLDAMRFSLKHGKSTNVRGPRRKREVEVSFSHLSQNESGNMQFEFTHRIQQILNPEMRNTAVVELRKAIKHLGIVEKLLEINELIHEKA